MTRIIEHLAHWPALELWAWSCGCFASMCGVLAIFLTLLRKDRGRKTTNR